MYVVKYIKILPYCIKHVIYWVAEKSLAQPGRETNYRNQTLTFASHSKTIQKVVRPTKVSMAAMTSVSDEKW